MEIKLINYLLLTYWMLHGNSAEEGDTERAAERRGEAGPGLLAGEWRARESRDGERLESGLWRALERPRQRERQSDGESGRGWRVESLGCRHSSGSRRPAVQTPADSSGSCGTAGGRRRDDGWRQRGGELKKKRRAAAEGKREILGKKVRFSHFSDFQF
jgi:hypothetical protein